MTNAVCSDVTQVSVKDRDLSSRLEKLADRLSKGLNSCDSVDYLVTSNMHDELIDVLYISYSPNSERIIEIEPQYDTKNYKIKLTVCDNEFSRLISKVVGSTPVNELDRRSIDAISHMQQGDHINQDMVLFYLEIGQEELDECVTELYTRKYLEN